MAVSGNDIPRVETITVEPQADMITVEPQEETATIDTDLAEYHADQEREHHTRFERLIGLAQYTHTHNLLTPGGLAERATINSLMVHI